MSEGICLVRKVCLLRRGRHALACVYKGKSGRTVGHGMGRSSRETTRVQVDQGGVQGSVQWGLTDTSNSKRDSKHCCPEWVLVAALCGPHVSPCSGQKTQRREFPGDPVVGTPRFHCQGQGFDPWLGN